MHFYQYHLCNSDRIAAFTHKLEKRPPESGNKINSSTTTNHSTPCVAGALNCLIAGKIANNAHAWLYNTKQRQLVRRVISPSSQRNDHHSTLHRVSSVKVYGPESLDHVAHQLGSNSR